MSIKQFKDMVSNHDLTYSYSDDGAVWRRGQAAKDAIVALAKTLDREICVEIWNAKVDKTLSPDFRAPFYWK